MKQLVTLILLLSCGLVRAQSYKGTTSLNYETPSTRNGLRYTGLNFSWEVQKPGLFGDLAIIFEATASPNYTEYIYGGKYYTSHGEQESLFRLVHMTSYKVKARVEGPGFSQVMTLYGTAGMGGGAFFGNSKYLVDAKTKEQATVQNWTVTPLLVEEVSWDGGEPLRQQIDREEATRRRQEAVAKALEAGDAAGRRGDWPEALRQYQAAKSKDAANETIGPRIDKAQEEMRKKGVKERYDDLLRAGQQAEGRGNKREAQRLYDQAAAAGHDDPGAAQASSRVGQQLAEEEKQRQQEQAAKEAAETAKAEKARQTKEADAQQAKEKMEALQRAQEAAAQVRHDSLKMAMAEAERTRLDEAREKQQREQREEEEAAEKRREDELTTEAKNRRDGDKDALDDAEQHMAYDPERYYEARQAAQEAFDEANGINPFDALELQREWWDNNEYIQVIADDLYEEQRQNNHRAYEQRIYEEKAAWNKAKDRFIAAVEFVDRDSPQHEYLLGRIELCNKMLDSDQRMAKDSYRMEMQRRENRVRTKMLVAAQMRAANRVRVEAAFMVYEMNIKPGENSSQYLMDKLAFEEKLNKADAQYKQDAIVTGVSQSVALDVLGDDSKYVQAAGNGSFMLNAYLGGLGMENLPILMNHTADTGTKTETDGVTVIPLCAGFDMWFVRSHFIDVGIGGYGSFGVFPSTGSAAAALSWGGKGRLDFGGRRFKLANTVEYLGRAASYEVDYDVILSANNQYYQYQNHTASGKLDYTVLRVGTGFKLDISDDEDRFVLAQVFAEKPSFYPYELLKKPVFSYKVEGQFGSGWTLRAAYAHNYVIGGERQYGLSESENRDYWSVTLGKSWTLINSRPATK
jgi:hypothetical protein